MLLATKNALKNAIALIKYYPMFYAATHFFVCVFLVNVSDAKGYAEFITFLYQLTD